MDACLWKDNWYLTYPSFHVAASKKAMEDPKREELLLKIMEALQRRMVTIH